MDAQRRHRLTDKYGLDQPPTDPSTNPQVQAALRAERMATAIGGDSLHNMLLTDPTWRPAMHAKLITELEALHALEQESGGAVYQTFRGEVYNPHDPIDTDGTVLLKFPGDRRIFVCRSNADRLSAAMAVQGPFGVCDVCIAEDCQAMTFYDHPTRPLPISCGRVVLMFEICIACDFVVSDAAYYNMRASVIAEQAKLPPGAVIDPGSPIPPQP
jgi:hypothetical protein